MKNSAKSKNLKKFVALLEFLTTTIADMLVPGSGIVLDALFLLLELMEKDEIEDEEMMQERGVEVDHSTLNRWVLKYAPELDKRIRPHLKQTNDSWRVDETYIKAECRRGNYSSAEPPCQKAVEVFVPRCRLTRQYLGLSLSAKRDARAAERFLCKTLRASHTQMPRVINVDKNAAYPPAVDDMKADEHLPETAELRQVKYLNNRVEQDHRFPCATNKARDGIWFMQHGTTNHQRIGSDEYASQRTIRSRQRLLTE